MVHDPRVSQQLSRLGGIYRDPARVDRDAATLLKSQVGSHLQPIAAEFIENNGNCQTVLVLQGTIAIHFRGNTYQLLIDLYLPMGYPRTPPVTFVRLADNMYLKENHRHVGSDGKVYLPYLHEWNPSTHNLIELVVAMSSVFSDDPPVFTKQPDPPSSRGSSMHTSVASSRASSMHTSSGTTVISSVVDSSTGSSQLSASEERVRLEVLAFEEVRLAKEAREANAAAEAARKAEQEEKKRAEEEKRRADQVAAQRAWEEKKTKQVREQVAAKIRAYAVKATATCQQQVKQDRRDQQRLQLAKEQKIDLQLKLYRQKKQDLERQLAVAEESYEDIQAWLNEAENNNKDNKSSSNGVVSLVDAVQPASPLHAQMLDLAAENAAISDALYFLDRALYKGNLDCQAHLRQVRRLAKRQFLVRAHLIKINQVMLS